jgi:hypothetical protein
MQVTVSGSTATLSFGDGSDQITVNMGLGSPVTVAFADGTSMQISPESFASRMRRVA